jgi:hypothetical protein
MQVGIIPYDRIAAVEIAAGLCVWLQNGKNLLTKAF